MENNYHVPVMLEEVLGFLVTDKDGVYVDGTLGGGGHSAALLDCLGAAGMVVGLDRDIDALCFAEKRLQKFGSRFRAVQSNFREIPQVLADLGIKQISGFLLDLGVSSFQIDTVSRGFSYQVPAKLDMRMSQDQALTAEDVINSYDEQALVRIFFEYGEERFARRITRRVIQGRKTGRIVDSEMLRTIVQAAVPFRQQVKSVARVFQALRIEVNQELVSLEEGLREVVAFLKPGGRIVVIAYHSLEDRIVKRFFREEARECVCPPQFPKCICGARRQLKLVTRKAVKPGELEIQSNSRSRSARLRAAEKCG